MMTPGSLYPAKDGSVIIATGNLGQVQRLFRLIGGEDLVNSPMCVQQSERIKFREQIDELVGEWTKKQTREEIASKLKEIDIACGIVPEFNEVCEDAHLKSREMITEIEQTISGKVRVPGSLFKLSKTPGDIALPAPYHGQHTMEVLTQMLGYSETEIDEFYNKGII
jgi:crotonobetainyl-CoA:carnitine CoA-transferase CaiB-like acyl-CoA transferase